MASAVMPAKLGGPWTLVANARLLQRGCREQQMRRSERVLLDVPVSRNILETIQLLASAAQPETKRRADGRDASATDPVCAKGVQTTTNRAAAC